MIQNGRMLVFLLVGLSLLISGCASTGHTGVRTGYEKEPVERIAIVPFYARGNFGIEREEFRGIRENYEGATAAILESQGFEVVGPRAFRQELEALDLWDTFADGVRLRAPLTAYFEPGRDPTPIEIMTLRGLAESGEFPFTVLLFGEVVYHTEGSCQVSADRYNNYAEVHYATGTARTGKRACVGSHFRAKLVDLRTGHTMWFNRMFVETHARQLDDAMRQQNIARVVRATFAERGGLTALAPPEGRRQGERADQ